MFFMVLGERASSQNSETAKANQKSVCVTPSDYFAAPCVHRLRGGAIAEIRALSQSLRAFQAARGLMTYADRSLFSFRTMILYNRSYIATTVKKTILSLNWDKNKKHPKRGTFIFHITDINF